MRQQADARQHVLSHDAFLELRRQQRRIKGLISQLEKLPSSADMEMTIMDLDEIQSHIGYQLG